MDKFIQKLNFGFADNQKILQLIGEIDGFNGTWKVAEKLENRYLKELQEIATIESIGSSTRIEGATLSDSEVEKLLKDIKVTKLKTRDQQEVIGYYEVLELIYENHSEINLSENYIKQLHQILLQYSSKDQRHRGAYKQLSNKVVATSPGGDQRIIFNTTEPALVPGEMRELLDWTNEQLEQKRLHQLIVIGSFIYDFLSIHPFQDGNGRLARLLTTLCLLQNDYSYVRYISFENHIEQNKKAYYEALMSGQKNRGTDKERIDRWMVFFLESLNALAKKLEQKYEASKSKGAYLNDRQKLIRDFVSKNQPIKVSDLSREYPEFSLSTLKKDLKYMRAEKVLTMIGRGKGSVYVLSEKN